MKQTCPILVLTFLKGFLCLPIALCCHQLNWTSTGSSLPGAVKLVCSRFFVFKAPHLEKGHLVLMNTAHQMDLLTIFMVMIRRPAPMSGAATTTPISHDTVFFGVGALCLLAQTAAVASLTHLLKFLGLWHL